MDGVIVILRVVWFSPFAVQVFLPGFSEIEDIKVLVGDELIDD